MIDNTLENKAKFFALYYGQKIARYSTYEESEYHKCSTNPSECEYLELTQLSQISDEDFLEVMCMLFPFQPRASFKKGSIYMDHLNINQADYLRSKGYALPYLGTSVDTLIEHGWVKLKEVNND